MTGRPRGPQGPRGPRGPRARLAWGLVGSIVFLVFVGLGVWQVQRRTWKLDLIERVDARVQAAPVAAPGPLPGTTTWPAVTRAEDEYRRVRLRGQWRPAQETLVQATTDFGAGYWVMTPMLTEQGFTVLVNRGFVTADRRDPVSRGPADGSAVGSASVEVVGLLRVSEPEGAFLRRNDAAADRWYSRDVPAIAAARGLGPVAPYFVDLQADGGPPDPLAGPPSRWPVAGLTVIRFRNDHLVYALTWFGLALMTAAGTVYAVRSKAGDETAR